MVLNSFWKKYTKKLILTPKAMVQRNVTLWNQIQILYQLVSAGFVEPGLLTMDTRTPCAGTCFACRAC